MTFSDLSQTFAKLEETASRNTMTEVLAELFRHAHANEIGKLCYLLQGRVVPLYEAVEFGVADKFMIRAIALAYSKEEKVVVAAFKRTGDLGIAAQELHTGRSVTLSIVQVYEKLLAIAESNGQGSQEKKISLLADLLSSVDALSARYIARIPLDKLRLGFSDMTILDALSWMMTGDKTQRGRLEASYNVRPDIGLLATSIKEHGVGGLGHIHVTVGAPILAELCQRLSTADEMVKKMGGEVAVEPKYDGVRVQIHFVRSKVKSQKSKINTFSRNLENTTEMFPELTEMGEQLHADEVILDSEAVGMDPKTGRIIPFQETMTRKRKHEIAQALLSVPLRFYIFDILYKDGKELLSLPLCERRAILEKTIGKGKMLVISPQIVTRDPTTLRRYHDEQLAAGLEGVVVKRWDSPYEPGRRGFGWVKFKEVEGATGKLTDTIDAVVMGYYKGEGKRSDFGIGAFLVGVRKGDLFVTVTKIGTGVSDIQWKALVKKLNGIKTLHQPKQYADVNKNFTPDVWVAPNVVVEIAGDDLTKSSTHGAGVAVRFPRLVGLRDDKGPMDVTTVQEIHHMFATQNHSI